MWRPVDPRDLSGELPGALPAAASSRAGFGLIEAIVALAVAGLVLAAVTELAGRTLRGWNRGFSTVAAIERTDIALGRLGRDLAGLVPMRLATADDPAILFAGDERAMAFTAHTPLDRTDDGLAIVEYAVEATGGTTALVRRLRRGREVGLRDGDRIVLLAGRLDLAFAYRDQSGQRVSRWAKQGEVPRGVVVTLVGTREGGGLPVEVMLPIPVAISVSCLLPDASADPNEEAPPPGEPPTVRRGAGPGAPPEDPAAAPPAAAGARAKRCATGPSRQTNTEVDAQPRPGRTP